MMRNVAIGAVLGFGLVVLLLSIFNHDAPPPAPAPATTAASGPVVLPVAGTAPAPMMQVNTAPLRLDNERRQELMRQVLAERRNGRMAPVDAAPDAGP